jgi:hypothetical protein
MKMVITSPVVSSDIHVDVCLVAVVCCAAGVKRVYSVRDLMQPASVLTHKAAIWRACYSQRAITGMRREREPRTLCEGCVLAETGGYPSPIERRTRKAAWEHR